MRSFYINPATNDLDFDGSNNIKMVDGDDELIQSIKLIISTNVGEWFLNPEHGFDRSILQSKKVDESQATDALYAAVLQDERVATVDNIEFDFDRVNRKLDIKFTFTKKDGETVEGGVIV